MTALPRTDEQILAHIEQVQQADFFGAQQNGLLLALSYPAAKPLINDAIDEFEWASQYHTDAERVEDDARQYLSFAIGKADDHRGLSAVRSFDHYRAWMWLLGKDELIDWNRPTNYGAGVLRQISQVMGWEAEWDKLASPELNRMADGLPCVEGCQDGCGQ